jgi:hypothetical protein
VRCSLSSVSAASRDGDGFGDPNDESEEMVVKLAEYFHTSQAVLEFSKTYLTKRGWFASLDGVPRNNDGHVPWITYPAFVQLKRIVMPEFKVFEYGCGSSSLWWARNVAEVVSVEHNAAWAKSIIDIKPKNLTIIVREMNAAAEASQKAIVEPFFAAQPELPLSPDSKQNIVHGLLSREFVVYAAELSKYPVGYFDVIVVDGMARVLTAWLAGKYVKPKGFIVFDNSDRWQYNAGYKMLHDQGFSRIDYYGPAPANCNELCTSIFTQTLEPFAGNISSPKGDNDLGW